MADKYADVMKAAESRICSLGLGDHGHTDCWLFSELLEAIGEARRLAELAHSSGSFLPWEI